MKRPTLLAVEGIHRYRAPLLDQFYNYVQKPDFPINVVLDERRNTGVRQICEERLGLGIAPDYIMIGFGANSSLAKSKTFLRVNNNIKIIYDPGDYTVLCGNIRDLECKDIRVDFLVIRMLETKGHALVERAFNKLKTRPEFDNTKIIYLSWGVNPNLYPKPNCERDIDISIMYTATSHKRDIDRRIAVESLDKIWDKINGYCTTHCGPKLTPTKHPSGDTFGVKYLDVLRRSKLFVVEAGLQQQCIVDFPSQKYFEGPMCGAAMIGQIPSPLKDYLKHDESIIEVNDYTKLGEVVLDYLKRPEDIKRIAEEGRKVILENFTVDKVVKDFTNTILEDYKRKE